MQLPGIITVSANQPERLERAALILGDSFIEEMWTATWLSALDELGATPQRKRELLHAFFMDELRSYLPFQGVYLLDDLSAAAQGYLASEQRASGCPAHGDASAAAGSEFAACATAEERAALDAQEARMEAISQFDWTDALEGDADYIYFANWAVSSDARGKGSLRRMTTPFFDYADQHRLNCYLECYTDRLQSMYEHLGFEIVDVLSDPAFPVNERRMVRRPR